MASWLPRRAGLLARAASAMLCELTLSAVQRLRLGTCWVLGAALPCARWCGVVFVGVDVGEPLAAALGCCVLGVGSHSRAQL